MITLDNGTTIDKQLDGLVTLDHPQAPPHLRDVVVGRITSVDGGIGLAPALWFPGVLSAATLRALADLVDEAAEVDQS